jgi:hypothetical protein
MQDKLLQISHGQQMCVLRKPKDDNRFPEEHDGIGGVKMNKKIETQLQEIKELLNEAVELELPQTTFDYVTQRLEEIIKYLSLGI